MLGALGADACNMSRLGSPSVWDLKFGLLRPSDSDRSDEWREIVPPLPSTAGAVTVMSVLLCQYMNARAAGQQRWHVRTHIQ